VITTSGDAATRTPLNEGWRRFRRNKLGLVGAGIILALFLIAALAPVIAPSSPYAIVLSEAYKSPSPAHWFGTDEMGRDVLSRIIYGARIVVLVSLTSILLAAVSGALVGVAIGYAGGIIDDIVMRILDAMLAFPAFLLAIALVAFLGPSTTNIILVMAITRFPRFVRLIRGKTLSLKQMTFIEAARAIGVSDRRILTHHLLPGCMGPFVVYASLALAGAILGIAGLSFLGIGIQPPTADWGVMLSRGRQYLFSAPWLAIIPGLVIMITVLGFNLLGDGLRDALDPKT